MTFRDLIHVSAGNLTRMKLRAFLTMAGILIAIAAFVSMVSFGAGNQRNIEQRFNQLGLFSTMQVYQKRPENQNDTVRYAKLDVAALERIAAIPGVNLVYPYDAFTVEIRCNDTAVTTKAQALPTAALRTKIFSDLDTRSLLDTNRAGKVILSHELAKDLKFAVHDSAIGRKIIVSVRVSTIDSGLAHVFSHKGESILDRLKRIQVDSLFHRSYRGRILRTELNEALRRFSDGLLNAREAITDTLTVAVVRLDDDVGRLRIEPLIIPIETATKFSSRGIGTSPTEIFAAMNSGTLFANPDDPNVKTFSQATIDFDPKIVYTTIKDSVEAMGFRTFSFAEQFEEIQQAFLYFDLALGVVGLIALITASLGIVNTMVMSINERRREIGVLKALGADESDIRKLFLVESGVMGLIGTLGGILFGWTITRIVSAIAQHYMEKEGITPMDLFALPLWLFLIALGVGVGVSLLAGFYPAARAARVDPVAALRND